MAIGNDTYEGSSSSHCSDDIRIDIRIPISLSWLFGRRYRQFLYYSAVLGDRCGVYLVDLFTIIVYVVISTKTIDSSSPLRRSTRISLFWFWVSLSFVFVPANVWLGLRVFFPVRALALIHSIIISTRSLRSFPLFILHSFHSSVLLCSILFIILFAVSLVFSSCVLRLMAYVCHRSCRTRDDSHGIASSDALLRLRCASSQCGRG